MTFKSKLIFSVLALVAIVLVVKVLLGTAAPFILGAITGGSLALAVHWIKRQ